MALMPKAVLDNLYDPGIYYVYEKGQLRAPPGYCHQYYEVTHNHVNLA